MNLANYGYSFIFPATQVTKFDNVIIRILKTTCIFYFL